MNEDYQEKSAQQPASPSKLPLILSILSVIGVVALFILYFTGNNCENKEQSSTGTPFTSQTQPVSFDGDMKIAYVDTERIMQEYEYVNEIQKDVENMRARKVKEFENKYNKLQSDVQSYIQIGATLTLAQQQEREAEFQRREMQLGQEEQLIVAEISEYNMAKNVVLADSIINYINRYNTNKNYTLILEKSGINGVIYGDKALDITDDVLNGLNAEYSQPL